MATITITKVAQNAGPDPVYYPDIYRSMKVGDVVVTTRAASDLSRMTSIMAGEAAGDLTVGVVYADFEQPPAGSVTIDDAVGVGAGFSIAAVPAAFTLSGSNFLQGQPLDSFVFGTGTSSLTVKANRPGVSGLTVALVDAAAASVAVVGSAITVNFRGATHGNADVASAVATLINGNATAKKLIHATAGGGGNLVAVAATPLAGGKAGDVLNVLVGGQQQDIINTPTETTISCQTANLSGFAGTESAALVVVSRQARSNTVSVPIVA